MRESKVLLENKMYYNRCGFYGKMMNMISFLEGTIKAARKNYIIVMTDYVGYKVFVTPQILLNTKAAQKVSLYIYTHVREDVLALYGFFSLPELEFFELLLSVSGIGPKMALSILSIGDLGTIKSGILNQDPTVFTQVSGVGRKTGERLIMELKDRVSDSAAAVDLTPSLAAHADVMDVLVALGYSKTEARGAISQVPTDLASSEDKIRYALRSLAKH